MKIGILGTRGIPNHYGGFEQFAEYLSVGLVERGHEVTVYNSHNHAYAQDTYKGVNLVHCYDPENRTGTMGQFIYDLNCIMDSRKRDYDVLLQLGYTSSSVWSRLMSSRQVIITNMDGMEWKRSKYGKLTQRFLRRAEKWAVRRSHHLVADSVGISDYLTKRYHVDSTYIPYGADIFDDPRSILIESYDLAPGSYDMLIARLEPENNIEMILEGFMQSSMSREFLVIGNHSTRYGEYLKLKYPHPQIRFVGAIYDMVRLNNIRHYSNLYFHGHSVGGTNPSLLEAMASGALVCAHNNVFNKSILADGGLYFNTAAQVGILISEARKKSVDPLVEMAMNRVRTHYSWPSIVDSYEKLFARAVNA